MKYERLTIRNSDGSVSQPTHSTFEKVFNRLAELEDDLESGKIMRLPCKAGDTVYCIYQMYDGRIECFDEKVLYIEVRKNNHIEVVTLKTFLEKATRIKVCYTREEAKARLKELQK